MMKKYIILYFGILMYTLGNFQANAMMGPLPLPYPNQSYQTNPASKMTLQQKTAVNQAFSWAQSMLQRNHTYLCKNRGECLNLDLGTLATFVNNRPTHPARVLFQNIYNIIRHDSHHQKFVTQWVIFKNLSQQRQAEYRNGIRVSPIHPQNVKTSSGSIVPALFNQDDVFTDLLGEVDHHHKNCEEYVTCLSGDLQIVRRLHDRLASNDPVRTSLKSLSQIIRNLAAQQTFNTNLYLTLYNPLSPDWNDTFKKHKAKKIAGYGYAEWRQVDKNSRAVSWRAPRITNSAPLPQSQNLRSNVQGMKSNVQNFKSNLQENKKLGREWWDENKDLLRGWW